MKVTVCIAGQSSGNYKLLAKLHNYEAKREGFQNSIYIQYPNKATAQKDLQEAFWKLQEEEFPVDPNLALTRDTGNRPVCVRYDASTASII